MATRFHRLLKIKALNANDIGRQRYELSKQLQGLHVDVVLFSETYLKPHERFFIPNYHLYRIDRYPGRKGRTGVYIPIGKSKVLFEAAYKSPSRAWRDADITKLLNIRGKSILA
jgi:hypothetical protein